MADEFDPPDNAADEFGPDSPGWFTATGPRGTVERNAARDVDMAMQLQGQSRQQREIIQRATYDATDNPNLSPQQKRQAIQNLGGYEKRLGFRFDWAEWRRERRARGEKS